MAKIKYVGNGLRSRGIHFDPHKNGGVYDVDQEFAEYLVNTFNDFIMIENTVAEKPTKKRQSRRKQKKEPEQTESTETTEQAE
jgi:hypothetical protein